jgi:cobalt-zinc-cadmium efflux system membrane fusion protein
MRMPLPLTLTLTLTLSAAILAVSTACNHKASALAAPAGATNETALTTEQIQRMKITTVLVDLQDVDDTVLTSGKVAYDDQKVIHVFSPVTGKAVKVLAQLGNHVKKGDPLVVIESPDIGVATSDVGKARADLIAAEHDFRRQ